MLSQLLDLIFPHRKQIRTLEADIFSLRNEITELKKDVLGDEEINFDDLGLSKEERIFSFLEVPRTTTETAHYFAESRTWTSLQLNRLERAGKIQAVSRSTKGKYYQTIK